MELKNTKDIRDLKEAIKAQDLNVQYYIDEAESIARELKKEYSHRSYVYEKIKHLKQLEDY